MRRWLVAVGTLALLETLAAAQPTAQLTTPPLSPPPERPVFGAPDLKPSNSTRRPTLRDGARDCALCKFFRKLLTWWRPANVESREQSPVEAAAAKMRHDEATARGRIAALQYLATVPCHHSPAVESALLAKEPSPLRLSGFQMPDAKHSGRDEEDAWRRWAETFGTHPPAASGRALPPAPSLSYGAPQPPPLTYIGQVPTQPFSVPR